MGVKAKVGDLVRVTRGVGHNFGIGEVLKVTGIEIWHGSDVMFECEEYPHRFTHDGYIPMSQYLEPIDFVVIKGEN